MQERANLCTFFIRGSPAAVTSLVALASELFAWYRNSDPPMLLSRERIRNQNDTSRSTFSTDTRADTQHLVDQICYCNITIPSIPSLTIDEIPFTRVRLLHYFNNPHHRGIENFSDMFDQTLSEDKRNYFS